MFFEIKTQACLVFQEISRWELTEDTSAWMFEFVGVWNWRVNGVGLMCINGSNVLKHGFKQFEHVCMYFDLWVKSSVMCSSVGLSCLITETIGVMFSTLWVGHIYLFNLLLQVNFFLITGESSVAVI